VAEIFLLPLNFFCLHNSPSDPIIYPRPDKWKNQKKRRYSKNEITTPFLQKSSEKKNCSGIEAINKHYLEKAYTSIRTRGEGVLNAQREKSNISCPPDTTSRGGLRSTGTKCVKG